MNLEVGKLYQLAPAFLREITVTFWRQGNGYPAIEVAIGTIVLLVAMPSENRDRSDALVLWEDAVWWCDSFCLFPVDENLDPDSYAKHA